jgi:hypothetical protein
MNLEYLRNLALGSVATRQNLQSLDLLLWGQLRAIATDAALCPGPRQAELCSFSQHLALKLSEAPEHLHEHSANRREGINRFGQGTEAGTSILKCFQDSQEISE